MKLNPKQVKQWKKGFEEVEKFHVEELRRKTPEEKLAELDALFRTAQIFGWDRRKSPPQEKEIQMVRKRWIKIKKGLKLGRKN
jgi:hypothetical protein